jgi:hypothetical protein
MEAPNLPAVLRNGGCGGDAEERQPGRGSAIVEKLQAGFELSGIDEMRNLLECVLKALEQGF